MSPHRAFLLLRLLAVACLAERDGSNQPLQLPAGEDVEVATRAALDSTVSPSKIGTLPNGQDLMQVCRLVLAWPCLVPGIARVTCS